MKSLLNITLLLEMNTEGYQIKSLIVWTFFFKDDMVPRSWNNIGSLRENQNAS